MSPSLPAQMPTQRIWWMGTHQSERLQPLVSLHVHPSCHQNLPHRSYHHHCSLTPSANSDAHPTPFSGSGAHTMPSAGSDAHTTPSAGSGTHRTYLMDMHAAKERLWLPASLCTLILLSNTALSLLLPPPPPHGFCWL